MASRLRYADALKLLGRDDSAVLDAGEKLADGGLAALGVPDLFGLRTEMVRLGRRALTGLREKVTGVSRMDRTERVAAALDVLVVVATFEGLGRALEEAGDLLSADDIGLTTAERWETAALAARPSAADAVSAWLDPEGRAVEWMALEGDLLGSLEGRVRATGADADADAWQQVGSAFSHHAERQFTELFRQLAADVPEFGVWAAMAEHRATRDRVAEVQTGLGGLRDTLAAMEPRAAADRRRTELAAVYQAVLNQPLLRTADLPDGLRLPTLESSYLAPAGRLDVVTTGSVPSSESAWKHLPVREDLPTVLAGLLTQPGAVLRPIVILGHPGAGKSVLTQMLAARLSAADFLPLRVELRGVRPNAPIHAQIEEGMAATLNTSVRWRDLADAAEGALPVVILDGFDELLQATGVNRSDYLEQVQEFQDRQRAIGQPVAVIVTSRTVVADRARFPALTPAVRLEPFDARRVARMVEIWNDANAAALRARGLVPLSPEAVLRFRELAEQPLLLLMLLVYDSADNALARSAAGLSRSGLYEQLLTMFAEREVRKHHAHLGPAELARAVEDELHRLEVVALAMFARLRQYVTAAELDQDLAVLMPDAGVRPADPGLHGALSDAHQVLGRFFFVHESQARTDTRDASVFEFLHATFGEYLVARAVTAELAELLEARRFAARRHRGAPPLDDGLLYALTSFALLAGTRPMVEFTQDLLDRRIAGDEEERAAYRELLVELFREAPYPAAGRSYTAYQPRRMPVTGRQAAYTANLALLVTRVCPEGVELSELLGTERGVLHEWGGLASQWRRLPNSQWHGQVDAIRLRHLGFDGPEPRSVLVPDEGEPVNVGECVGFELVSETRGQVAVRSPYDIVIPGRGLTGTLLRSSAMRVQGTVGRLVLMLLPYLTHVGDELVAWLADPEGGEPWSEAHDILELRLGPPRPATEAEAERRVRCYERLLSGERLDSSHVLVLRQAAEDLSLLRVGEGQLRGSYGDVLWRTVYSGLYRFEGLSPDVAAAPEVVERVLHQLTRGPSGIVAGLGWPQESLDRLLDRLLNPGAEPTPQGWSGRVRPRADSDQTVSSPADAGTATAGGGAVMSSAGEPGPSAGGPPRRSPRPRHRPYDPFYGNNGSGSGGAG
ncbi:hypothetical protein LG943_09150 [Streptomonospora sp. S1-112]|uniref:AAA+ ATPase domain-containing protein n=1 Tax=Streptomonospora mangrovi TaxID=2883123 RepID=A0A9X3SMU7_9ACTN|nr:hypothetical protein [Streptomonospora mangrovi]MDA0564491.1 hypothetical protein [Streptomonospora mangrovi]